MRPSEDISSKDQSSVLNATALMQVMANMYEKNELKGYCIIKQVVCIYGGTYFSCFIT